jgi:hypothetical protein
MSGSILLKVWRNGKRCGQRIWLRGNRKNWGLRIVECGLSEKNPKSEIRNPK